MKKNIAAIIIAVIAACAVSYAGNSNALENFRFKAGLYDYDIEKKHIETTLKLFNRHFATLFNTGGRQGTALNSIPAANMIKRRIVQEINDWAKEGHVLVYDRDVFELESTELLSPRRAVAVAREVWFLNVQNMEKRTKKSGVKASPVRVRYLLRKIERGWHVIEYEVFGMDDSIPPLIIERVWL